jgi:hypothetical protein
MQDEINVAVMKILENENEGNKYANMANYMGSASKVPHSFWAETSGSECFWVFLSVSDHISTKFRVFPSGS